MRDSPPVDDDKYTFCAFFHLVRMCEQERGTRQNGGARPNWGNNSDHRSSGKIISTTQELVPIGLFLAAGRAPRVPAGDAWVDAQLPNSTCHHSILPPSRFYVVTTGMLDCRSSG
jgi:hypothetical protein